MSALVRSVVGGASGGAPPDPITLVTGSDTQVGDVLLCLHGKDYYTASTMTTPTGTAGTWTQQGAVDAGTNRAKIKAWTRPVTVAGAQTVTVPSGDAAGIFNIVFVLSGSDTSTPTLVVATGFSATSVTSLVAPTVTPGVTGTLLLCTWQTGGIRSANTNHTVPGSMTKLTEQDSGFSTMSAASEVLASAAASGTRTATSANPDSYASMSIVIASGAATTTAALAGSTGRPTSALTGTVSQAGALAGTRAAPTSTLAGTVSQTGALAGQPPKPTAAILAVIPTVRYVDNAVGASGTGQSWATAWKNLSDINWASLPPGSIVYVSGGTVSKTYSETLAPAASGTSTAPITIARGVDAGHTGVPILDGGNTRATCYDNGGYIGAARNYVTIFGLRLQDPTENPVWVRAATGCVIDTCEVIAPDNPVYGQALYLNQNTDLTVRRCTITTPALTTAQADGIYAQDNLGTTLIEDNTITVSNTDDTGHSDAVQTHQNGRTVIRRNVLYSSTAGPNNHVMWLHAFTDGTTSEVYSNVLISRGGQHNLTYWRELAGSGHGTLLVYNNTIYGGGRALNFERVTNVEVKNNIVVSDTAGTAVYSNLNDLTTTAVTHNIVRAPSGTIARTVANGNRSYAQWTADGFNASGLSADPLLVSPPTDLRLQPTSPARDAGTTLALVTGDVDGVARPQYLAYDIGAYESLVTAGALAGSTSAPISALAGIGAATATGVLAGSTSAPTSALAGTCSATGVVAGSRTPPTSALAGTVTDTGALAGTTQVVTGSITATATAAGALAGSRLAPTSTLAGTVSQSGALAGSTSAPTGVLAGTAIDAGALAGSTQTVTGSLAATATTTGPLAGTTAQPTGSVAGTTTATGALAGSSPTPISTLAGTGTATGALSGTTPAPGSALAGTNISGALAGSTPAPGAALAAQVSLTGALSGSSPAVTGSLVATTTAATTGALAAGTPAPTAEVLGTCTATGALAGTTPGATAQIVESASAGFLAAELPAPTTGITADVSTTGALAGAATVPATALVGEASTTGALAATAPTPTADLGGNTVTGDLAATVPAATGSLAGQPSTTGGITATAPTGLAELTGTAAATGEVTATAPTATAAITGTGGLTGTLAGSGPVPVVVIFSGAVGSAVRGPTTVALDDRYGGGVVLEPAAATALVVAEPCTVDVGDMGGGVVLAPARVEALLTA